MKFLRTYKEEIVIIPILMILMGLYREITHQIAPTTAQYDMFSEFETLFWAIIRLIILALAAWMSLRVLFPKSFFYLKNEVYDKFDEYTSDVKFQTSTKLFFALLLALILLSCNRAHASEQKLRVDLVDLLHDQLHVRELTGKNDGVEVAMYLKSVGLGEGYPWCAAFTTWGLNEFNIPNPQSAWSPAWARSKDIIWRPKGKQATVMPGDVFSIWFTRLNRVGHVGFVVSKTNSHFITIEGNTNSGGSREGDGVYKRKRLKSKIYAITNYISPYANTHPVKLSDASKQLQNKVQYNHLGGRKNQYRNEGDAEGYIFIRAAISHYTNIVSRCIGAGYPSTQIADGKFKTEPVCYRWPSHGKVRVRQHAHIRNAARQAHTAQTILRATKPHREKGAVYPSMGVDTLNSWCMLGAYSHISNHFSN